MKLIEILKREDMCKFRKEAEIRLKAGRIKIDNVVVKENIDLEITGEILTADDWLNKLNLTDVQWRMLMLFCTPPQPSGGMAGIDYLFDKTELWEDLSLLSKLPFLNDINEGKIKLLQIAKRDKFIIK